MTGNLKAGESPKQAVENENPKVSEVHHAAPQSGFPERYIIFGTVVGLCLIALGMCMIYFNKASISSSLMTCVGFGLVLAAFGAKAEGSWGRWNATGAGALSVMLFLVLQYYSPDNIGKYKKGTLRGDLTQIADLRIVDDYPLYQYRDRTTSSIKFIMLENKLNSKRISIQVDTNETGYGKEFFEMVGDAELIKKKYLADDFDISNIMQWTFDYQKRLVSDGEEVIFSENGQIKPNNNVAMIRDAGFLSSAEDLSFVQSALAGDIQPGQNLRAQSLLEQLKAEDTFLRRNARDELAALGPQIVPVLIQYLRENFNDYRVRLGSVYALAEMLRENPERRIVVMEAIGDEDVSLLVKAASEPDKTISLQAAEFLYMLQDPRTVEPSLAAAREANDEVKAGNQILIIRESGQELPNVEKRRIIEELQIPLGSNNDIVKNPDFLKDVFKW